MKSPSAEERYIGSVVGVAAGDVLGAPHEGFDLSVYPTDEMIENSEHPEFMKPIYEFIRSIHDEHDGVVKDILESSGFWAFGEQTDDTAQTVRVIDSINQLGKFDMEDITKRLVKWYDGGMGRGLGGTSALSLMLAEAGVVWQETGFKAIDMGQVSFRSKKSGNLWKVSAIPSNGSLMRTTPVGLYFSGSPEKIDMAAEDLSIVTHAFDACIDTCKLASQLIGKLAEGWSKDEAIDYVESQYPEIFNEAISTVNQDFAHTGGAYTSLGIALEAFMGNDNFEDTIIAAANPQTWSPIKSWGKGYNGPDTDTYAAITGGIAGALYGIEQIPTRWTDVMNPLSGDHLKLKAIELYARSIERKSK